MDGNLSDLGKVARKPENVETLPPLELDQILQSLYAELRKKNGEEYEPNSLAAMQAGIERYLKEKKYGYNILDSLEFSSS